MRINAKLEVKIMHRNLQLFTQTIDMQEMHVSFLNQTFEIFWFEITWTNFELSVLRFGPPNYDVNGKK